MIRPYSCFSYLLENTKWTIKNGQFRDTDKAFIWHGHWLQSERLFRNKDCLSFYPSREPEIILGFFCGIRVAHLFKVVFVFVCLPFVSCAQCCLDRWIVHSWLPFSLLNNLLAIIIKDDWLLTERHHLGNRRCPLGSGWSSYDIDLKK